MYYGKMTEELDELYNQYYNKFGEYPNCHEELEYGDATYKLYVKDIKKALEKEMVLTDFIKAGDDFE